MSNQSFDNQDDVNTKNESKIDIPKKNEKNSII